MSESRGSGTLLGKLGVNILDATEYSYTILRLIKLFYFSK